MRNNQSSSCLLAFCCVFMFFSYATSEGQTIDTTFVPPFMLRQANVLEIRQAAKGKAYILGDLDYYGDAPVAKVIRLTTLTGYRDASFKADLPETFLPTKIDILPNGNVLVASLSEIYLLSSNGRRLRSMSMYGISCIKALPYNKFLVATITGGLYRYNKYFKLDNTFNNHPDFVDNYIMDIQPQGEKLIISGMFSYVLGLEKNDLARLNPDGSLDASFDSGSGTSGNFGHLYIQPDNKIISIRSAVYDYNGVPRSGAVRVNPDGDIDLTFNFTPYQFIRDAFYYNGKLFLNTSNKIVRTYDNGTIDPTFVPISNKNQVLAVNFMNDKTLLLGNYQNDRYGILKFDTLGQQVSRYHPPVARVGTINSIDNVGSKIVVGGDFFKINDLYTYNVAILDSTGTVDPSFKMVDNHGPVSKVAAVSDGILSVAFYNLYKTTFTGAMHPDFHFSPFKSLVEVDRLEVAADEKIMVASSRGIYRLNPNGSEDVSFDSEVNQCWCASIDDFAIQSSGKIVFASWVRNVDGVSKAGIVRLNPDGSVDETFDVGAGPNNNYIGNIEVLHDDALLVNGFFTQFNGYTTPYHLVKLSADGAIDPAFSSAFANYSIVNHYNSIHEFRNTILIASMTAIKQINLRGFHLDGTYAGEFAFPSEISAIREFYDFYSTNDRTLFLLGDIIINGKQRRVPLLKVNYESPVTTRMTAESWAIDFYPNPVEEKITFRNVPDGSRVVITSLNGLRQLDSPLDKRNEMDVSRLPKGNYIITIITNKITTIQRHMLKN